jgi:pyridoxal phosphate enzyme (YggS family)
MATGPDTIAGRVAEVCERIAEAAGRAGRQAGDVTLVAVSKTFPALLIREAYAAGVRHFGENRVQEWDTKQPEVADLRATWHLVGHLQRNKASRALSLFHTVDSLDSLPLAEKLDRAAADSRIVPVLIEVRLDPAVSKSGCLPAELSRFAEGVLLMPNLDLRGLMTIPPESANLDEARVVFRKLRELRDALSKQLNRSLPELSIGMSHDFEVAIEEGATQVRVGTALFGARPPLARHAR